MYFEMLQNDNSSMGLESVTELLKEVYYNTNHEHVSYIGKRFFTGTKDNPFNKIYINFDDYANQMGL